MSPGDVLDRHTSRELQEWQAYFQVQRAEAELARARAEQERQVAGKMKPTFGGE